jgi:catecholate siderophore receptor
VTPSSFKYTEPLRDIPQTITVIPKTLIESQGAATLRDVLNNVSGITMTAGEGGTPAGDNLSVRGFSARNDVFIDGARDLGPQSRDPFNLEQIEVVKGPGSAYTGRGSTGGSINLVSKTPAIDTFYNGSLTLGTNENSRMTLDVNSAVKALGSRTALRLNLMGTNSGVAGRDVVRNKRWGAAPSLAFGIGTPTRLSLNYFHMEQDNISDYGIPWVPATNNVLVEFRDKPAPVPRNTFYGLKSRDYEKMMSNLGTVVIDHDFTDSVTLRNQLRYGHSRRDSNASPPRFAGNDSDAINREMRSWITADDIWNNETNLKAGFSTGKIEHTLITGLGLTREGNIRKTRTAANMPTTLLNPNPNDTYTGTIIPGAFVGDVTGDTISLYAFDTLKFGKQWEFTGGMRWERFAVDGVSTTPAPISRVDRMPSLRGGIVYKPKSNGSIYASYGTSLNPSLEGLSYSTATTAIAPEKTYSYEIGSKWDLINERLLLSGAVFRIEKTNARTPGILPDDPPQVLNGRQRTAGFEVGATGNMSRSWKVFGGYTFLNAEITRSNTPGEVGKKIQNAPENSFNIWTTYRKGNIELGGGGRYVGKRYGNNTNTRWVDGYSTVDLMAGYPLNDRLEIRLNLYNLTDTFFFDRLAGGHLVPGPARSAAISTNFRF